MKRVEYGPKVTALNAVALNGAEALRTSDAIQVRDDEFLRVEYSLVLDGTGSAADDTLTFNFLGSQDNGATFKLLRKIASDDVVTAFAPVYTLVAADVTALVADGNLGSIHVVGLTHVKVRATASGSPDADNKITVNVRACRE